MSRFLFIIECVLAVLVAIPILIIIGGIVRSFMIVVRTFYDALVEEETLYPVSVTSQPARKMFAFDAGWRIISYVVQQMPMRVHISALNWIDACETMQYAIWSYLWFAPFLGWLAIIGLQIAARIQYVIVFIVSLLFLAIYALILIIWALCLLLCLGIVLLLKLYWHALYHYAVPCPHCYKPIEMSTHVCPKCQARHAHLRPGIYGILAHRCRSCRTLLPTLDVLGRKRLARLCPSCLHPLSEAIGRGASIRIALVGASAAGKTTYLIQAMAALSKKYRTWYRMSFADQEQRKDFEYDLRQLLQGKTLMASTALTPVPYVLHVRPSRLQASKLIYLYDPIGKVFTNSEYMARLEYYRYTHGVLFCIDASTLPTRTVSSGALQVVQTYERMMQLFEIFAGLRRGRRYTQSVAVVVTKVNESQPGGELGRAARQALMQKDSSLVSEIEAMQRLVRAFLCAHGLDNVVRDLESHFEHVRYFSCSTMEREDEKDGVQPTLSILEPLEWLLMRTRAIPRYYAKHSYE